MFQIFCTIMFLKVFGFENLASADPTDDLERDSSKYYSPDSRIFRFAILGLVYIITGILCELLLLLL